MSGRECDKILLIIFFMAFGHLLRAQSWLDSAVCRPDNTYCTFVDTINPRSFIPDTLQNIFIHKYQPHHPSERNQIFKIHYRTLILYVVRYNESGVDKLEEYFFWLFNPETMQISSQPFMIDGTWIADGEVGFDIKLMTRPLMEQRGKKMIVRERKHNGTAYNAIMQYTLTYDKNLNWRIKNMIEEKSLVETPVPEEFKSVVISRHYRGNKVLSYALRDLQHAKTEKIGEYRVADNGTIFKVKAFKNSHLASLIVSSYPENAVGYMEALWKQKHGIINY